jgi:hypothetical protein
MTGVHTAAILGAVFDLSRHAHYVHWHFFKMSVPNLIVIVAMVVVFVLAIALPFPRRSNAPAP